MTAYYNENDPKAAAWLRELIKAGAIAPGEVDDRSILDVTPAELAGFTQCHFFAGIGVWSYALRLAGWADHRPVWTGSCPCQPFSAAGKGDGFVDERHLWPAWQHLIEQCRPGIIFGEQVASKDAEPWLDLVQDDLEAMGYAFGSVAFPAAGIGAPHIRDRTYFVGHAQRPRLEGHGRHGSGSDGRPGAAGPTSQAGAAGGLVYASGARTGRDVGATSGAQGSLCGTRDSDGIYSSDPPVIAVAAGGVAHSDSAVTEQSAGQRAGPGETEGPGACSEPDRRSVLVEGQSEPGPTNGIWRDADWLYCRDGKWRPVEPGTFPLAHGAPARVGRLRGYGNAIVAEAAAEFILASQGVAP